MKLLRAPKLLTGRPDEVLLDAEVLVDGEPIRGVGVRGSQGADGAELVELELVMVSGRCVTQSQVDTAGSSVWLP